ncbi:MAG TPA: FGGY family carbohydrate kinase [Natronosporangium sp.]
MPTNPSRPPDLWGGVDVGTQSVRVVLVDDHGALAGRGFGTLDSTRDGRVHEQDPRQWWRVFGAACRQAIGELDPHRIRGLAICSTSGTFLLADRLGRPRTAALMYGDARAGAEAEEVAAAGAGLWTSLGYAMQRSWALPKLVWLLRHGEPALRTDADRGRLELLHCADYLARQLTGGRVATDWSHALKTGYDLDAGRWPTEVMDKLGIPAGLLPEVVRPGTEIGRVGRAGSDHTGLPVGTPVHAGMTDGCGALIAAGSLTPGSWNSVLGTTLVLKGVTATRISDPGGAIYSHRHPDGGWLPGGASNVGAEFLRSWFPDADPHQLDRAAARYEPSNGLVYPLVARGERFPFVEPAAEPFQLGSFVDDGDRYAAVLQGVAFVERLSFAYLRGLGAPVDGKLSATGGGTNSRYWCQLRADVLGREITLPRVPEPAFGMAVLAAAGEGRVSAAAERMVQVADVLAPRPDAAARFGDAYRRFVTALVARGYVDADLARLATADAEAG